MRIRCLFTVAFLFLFCSAGAYYHWSSPGWAVFFGALFFLGIYDVTQKRHAILRNFPVLGHFRYLLELVRPEIQQYFIESDISGAPISRVYRSVVYEKAKSELETVPFGSELDLYAPDYKWVNHSCFPVQCSESDFRIRIGNSQCRQPYNASLFNISAMSYGSLSSAAITALGNGAKAGGFYHNTGEGGLSPYHLATGADLVWQLGTAYFGARDQRGYFDPESFQKRAAHPNVKMIEIKISQGAKPGHGGILPGVKVDAEIAQIRQVEQGKTVVSPPGHTAFTTPDELCLFIDKLRTLTNGKPIGFKLCLGRREEFIQICEAIQKSKIYPDFITIDGGEGGTGAAPFDFINFVGSPLREALYFVDCTLKQFGLREHIRVIASGKVLTAFNLFEKLALGADLCNSARGMMLALGCIQSYRCNTNKCPTGITTNQPSLVSGLDITDKSVRVESYHRKTMEALCELLGAAGLHSAREVALKHISCRHDGRVFTLAELYSHTAELSEHEQRARHVASQGEPGVPEAPVT
jgi:glutamate synthase domain-containing protein 2